MKKALVVVAFFLISSFTAAVGADEFYIVRDLATQNALSSISDRPPTPEQ